MLKIIPRHNIQTANNGNSRLKKRFCSQHLSDSDKQRIAAAQQRERDESLEAEAWNRFQADAAKARGDHESAQQWQQAAEDEASRSPSPTE